MEILYRLTDSGLRSTDKHTLILMSFTTELQVFVVKVKKGGLYYILVSLTILIKILILIQQSFNS